MKNLLSIVLGAAMLLMQAPAQAQRLYSQAELDGLLAPVALYPDPLLSQILMASTYPADVGEAAAWSRAYGHLQGEAAVHAAHHQPWDPSVKSLLAFPDVLARMDQSPQWMMDLGQAFLAQEAHVMDTIQGLRQRAHAAGHLRSNQHYAVQLHGPAIVVVPVRPQIFFYSAFDWHHRHVRVVHRPTYVHVTHRHVAPGRWQHDHSRRAPAATHTYQRVPEANRQPIVQSAPALRVPESQRQPILQKHQPRGHPRQAEKERKPHPRQAHGRDRHG